LSPFEALQTISAINPSTHTYSTIKLTIGFNRHIFNRVVEQQALQLNLVFQALSDSTRREMLRLLAPGERTVSALAAPFAMSLAAVSKHIKVLERAGLVHRTVRGRTHICRLDATALAEANAWLQYYQQFWDDRLDAFETLFTESAKE